MTRKVVGTGEDPEFVIWVFQWIWHRLSLDGFMALFSTVWDAPIFHPVPGTLALSENFLIPAVLTYPLSRLTASAPLILGWVAQCSLWATAFSTWAWLRALGHEKFAPWAAFLFAAGGWIQDQGVHPQNQYLFVFPLLLLAIERFRARPTGSRAIAAGSLLGWIGGWNLYFQVFANGIALGAVLLYGAQERRQRRFRKKAWVLIGASCALAGSMEAIWAWPYLGLQATLGSYRVPTGAFAEHAARLSSFWAHSGVLSLLQWALPFYPAPKMGLESVGFLGFTFTLFCAWTAWKVKPARPWLAAALAAYWVALGPRAGAFSLARLLLPGLDGARAIGRLQVLVPLLCLPAMASGLEALKRARARRWVLALCWLELLPSGPSPRIEVPPEVAYAAEGTEWTRVLAQLDRGEPLWVLPSVTSRFQAGVRPVYPPLYGGYSGRMPIGYELLQAQMNAGGATRERIEEGLGYLGAPWVASSDVGMTEVLMRVESLRLEGCYAHGPGRICLFRNASRETAAERRESELSIDRDAEWEYPLEDGAAVARLHATRPGSLHVESVSGCLLEETLRGPLGIRWVSRRALQGPDFKGLRFGRGEVVLERVSKQWIFRLPPLIRFARTYRVDCAAGKRLNQPK